MKQPKNDSKYIWTTHAWEKMQQYGISEQRVKRIVRFPKRIEEGILDGAVAAMSPCGRSAVGRQPSHTSEMWVMYVIENSKLKAQKSKVGELDNIQSFLGNTGRRFKIITVWRYPGVSPVRDAIPDDVLSEIRALL
jgi:hypothetical protein